MSVGIVIHGAGGRMGREVAKVSLSDPDVRIVACIDRPEHPELGSDIGNACGLAPCGVTVEDSPGERDLSSSVIIDFSSPDASLRMLESFGRSSQAVVVGTTGFSASQKDVLEETAKEMALLQSPNMSLGVNLFFRLAAQAASALGRRYDVEIVEAHHRHKKDSPSGTAVKLGELVASELGLQYDDAARYGRRGMVGERSNQEIGMHAVRGGDIVGDHLVLFAGDGERIELRHMAHSRATFARGAVEAAKWLAGRAPGLYSMNDVLGF